MLLPWRSRHDACHRHDVIDIAHVTAMVQSAQCMHHDDSALRLSLPWCSWHCVHHCHDTVRTMHSITWYGTCSLSCASWSNPLLFCDVDIPGMGKGSFTHEMLEIFHVQHVKMWMHYAGVSLSLRSSLL